MLTLYQANKEAKLFKDFEATARKLNDKGLDTPGRAKKIEKLFDLTKETALLVEIKDIQDELNIVKSVLGQQKDVLVGMVQMLPAQDENFQSQEKSKGKKKAHFEDETLPRTEQTDSHKTIHGSVKIIF